MRKHALQCVVARSYFALRGAQIPPSTNFHNLCTIMQQTYKVVVLSLFRTHSKPESIYHRMFSKPYRNNKEKANSCRTNTGQSQRRRSFCRRMYWSLVFLLWSWGCLYWLLFANTSKPLHTYVQTSYKFLLAIQTPSFVHFLALFFGWFRFPFQLPMQNVKHGISLACWELIWFRKASCGCDWNPIAFFCDEVWKYF